ncbi:acyltransferase family protein [Ectopseudomonas alcaliphila]|uniref:acyltransferase family protein n=1 Tax=Ectopseudomonas alcaliphila TaxID=101564 RepID=UPI002782AE4B|nr:MULTISPECIES: acyltransferase [Pseudomonas]MDP9940112.1 peptidoglycan/LPS O-acetylase OafA/YrhL [Pseudomonas sp. 3400]MDR7012321.1 peptidoglycan/LPS O-acetylase OafA/YrhL [Pseudomonas alcaliphila]
MLLSDKTDYTRNNNLDLLRLIAAAMVIWSHAYPTVLGKGAKQPLTALTGGQFSMGDLGVAIFFVISGFLVSQSMFRLNDLTSYAKARALRIFPDLIFCVLLSILLIGPLFSTLNTAEHFTNSRTYNYLIATTTLNFLSPFLPGVFESNPYGSYINGSLWTLKYEVLC